MGGKDEAFHTRRRSDLTAAPPRYLFDRGSGAADLRSEKFKQRCQDQRQARLRGGRRHGRGGGCQGGGAGCADLRLRRRHGCGAEELDPQRRAPVGAGTRGDAPDIDPERAAKQSAHRDGRQADDRAGRRHRGDPRRGGVWLCDGAARDDGLRDDARMQPRHMSGGHCDTEPGAQEAL